MQQAACSAPGEYGPLNPYSKADGFAANLWSEMKRAIKRVCHEPPFNWVNFFDVDAAQRYTGHVLGDKRLMQLLYEATEAMERANASADAADELRREIAKALAPVAPHLQPGVTVPFNRAVAQSLLEALLAVQAAAASGRVSA